MVEMITIEPVKGRKARDPENQYAPITGPTNVQPTAYWTKRIAAGDVALVGDSKKSKAKK